MVQAVRIISLPTNMEFEDWANRLNLDLLDGTTVPTIRSVDEWWDWASQFIAINNFDGRVPLATKSSYPKKEDWETWARAFVDSFNYGGN